MPGQPGHPESSNGSPGVLIKGMLHVCPGVNLILPQNA